MDNRTCSVDGCIGVHHARGWCARHYATWRNTGSPLTEVTRHYRSPSDAFQARTERHGGCLIWRGSRTRDGYGFITVEGRLEMAHRYAWMVAHGPIPDGAEVDHICGNRSCCDVDHLRLASRRQNMRNRTGAQATSSTGVRNVYTEGTGFRVVVGRDYIGNFSTVEAARAAAEEARSAQFGEFAGRG